MNENTLIKVFISYSHDSKDHMNLVLSLSNQLRIDGIDCEIDQYEKSPSEGWALWCEKKIKEAKYVLVICTKNYHDRFYHSATKGKGVKFEGLVISNTLLSHEGNEKFIPVTFRQEDMQYIPTSISGGTHYCIENQSDYINVYRHLTNQPPVIKPDCGEVKPYPPEPTDTLTFDGERLFKDSIRSHENLVKPPSLVPQKSKTNFFSPRLRFVYVVTIFLVLVMVISIPFYSNPSSTFNSQWIGLTTDKLKEKDFLQSDDLKRFFGASSGLKFPLDMEELTSFEQEQELRSGCDLPERPWLGYLSPCYSKEEFPMTISLFLPDTIQAKMVIHYFDYNVEDFKADHIERNDTFGKKVSIEWRFDDRKTIRLLLFVFPYCRSDYDVLVSIKPKELFTIKKGVEE